MIWIVKLWKLRQYVYNKGREDPYNMDRWKWVEVAPGSWGVRPWDTESLCKAIEANGVCLTPNAKMSMQLTEFREALVGADPQQQFRLVAIPVEEIMGPGCGANPTDAIRASRKLGFESCLYWMVPRALVDYRPQLAEWLIVGSELLEGRLFGINKSSLYNTCPAWMGARDRLILVQPEVMTHQRQTVNRTTVVPRIGFLERFRRGRKGIIIA